MPTYNDNAACAIMRIVYNYTVVRRLVRFALYVYNALYGRYVYDNINMFYENSRGEDNEINYLRMSLSRERCIIMIYAVFV